MNDSPRVIVLAWFLAEDYAAHIRLDPKGMKPRFKQWLKDAEAEEKRLQASGYIVHRLVVDPQQLSAWALLRGEEINPGTRAAFTHEMFSKRQRH